MRQLAELSQEISELEGHRETTNGFSEYELLSLQIDELKLKASELRKRYHHILTPQPEEVLMMRDQTASRETIDDCEHSQRNRCSDVLARLLLIIINALLLQLTHPGTMCGV